MTDDRYVIVYRDGRMGAPKPVEMSNCTLFAAQWLKGDLRPAYRIRIREKPLPLHMTFVARMLDRLDPAKAYRAAGLRK